MGVAKGWKDGKMGSYLMGRKFQFQKMKNFWASVAKHYYTMYLKMGKTQFYVMIL